MTTNQQNREENWEEEFDKWMKEPDITNSGSNSPKMWQFEGYIAAKKEAKQFIRSTRQSAAKEAREEVLRKVKKLLDDESDDDVLRYELTKLTTK